MLQQPHLKGWTVYLRIKPGSLNLSLMCDVAARGSASPLPAAQHPGAGSWYISQCAFPLPIPLDCKAVFDSSLCRSLKINVAFLSETFKKASTVAQARRVSPETNASMSFKTKKL